MRLIDADRLKSYIDCEHLRPLTEVCFSELDLCNMIDKAPTVNQWIPCSERLPEVSGLYLVTTNKYGVWAARTDSYSVSDKEWKRKGDKKAVITAWMPLPEPYREDGES